MTNVPPVTKFTNLRELLDVRGRRTVEILPHSAEGYNRAVAIVTDRFGKQSSCRKPETTSKWKILTYSGNETACSKLNKRSYESAFIAKKRITNRQNVEKLPYRQNEKNFWSRRSSLSIAPARINHRNARVPQHVNTGKPCGVRTRIALSFAFCRGRVNIFGSNKIS